jgi:hypothetical protein
MYDMAQPIYKVWMLKKYTDAWYKLTPEEQEKQMSKVEQALKDAGGERVVSCVSLWSSEDCLGWGVEKFPDLEAVQKHAQLLWDIGHYKYFESVSYLGTEFSAG